MMRTDCHCADLERRALILHLVMAALLTLAVAAIWYLLTRPPHLISPHSF